MAARGRKLSRRAQQHRCLSNASTREPRGNRGGREETGLQGGMESRAWLRGGGHGSRHRQPGAEQREDEREKRGRDPWSAGARNGSELVVKHVRSSVTVPCAIASPPLSVSISQSVFRKPYPPVLVLLLPPRPFQLASTARTMQGPEALCQGLVFHLARCPHQSLPKPCAGISHALSLSLSLSRFPSCKQNKTSERVLNEYRHHMRLRPCAPAPMHVPVFSCVCASKRARCI